MEQVSSNKCFGGTQNVYSHQSQVLGVPSMTFARIFAATGSQRAGASLALSFWAYLHP